MKLMKLIALFFSVSAPHGSDNPLPLRGRSSPLTGIVLPGVACTLWKLWKSGSAKPLQAVTSRCKLSQNSRNLRRVSYFTTSNVIQSAFFSVSVFVSCFSCFSLPSLLSLWSPLRLKTHSPLLLMNSHSLPFIV